MISVLIVLAIRSAALILEQDSATRPHRSRLWP